MIINIIHCVLLTISVILIVLSIYYKRRSSQEIKKAKQLKLLHQRQQTQLNQNIKKLQDQQLNLVNSFNNKNKQLIQFQKQEKLRIAANLQVYKHSIQQQRQSILKEHIKQQRQLDNQIMDLQSQLLKLKETKAAIIEANKRQQQIQQNKQNYCLIPTKKQLQDIHNLQAIKDQLNNPRILSMLIWTEYYRGLAQKQFPIILGTKTKTGIYKITNLQTDECYIGQSKDVYKRFCQHCKCGLGIDTPQNNKLYKAMQKYGLQNFSFQLLQECPADQLDQKEKFYIEAYSAKDFGYNSTGGNGLGKI